MRRHSRWAICLRAIIAVSGLSLFTGCVSFIGQQENGIGLKYLQEGRIAEAEAEFKKAIAKNPQNGTYFNNLAVAYLRQGLVDEALSNFEKAAKLEPFAYTINNNYGDILRVKREFAKASERYTWSLVRYPTGLDARFGILHANFDQGLPLEPLIQKYEDGTRFYTTYNKAVAGESPTPFKLGLICSNEYSILWALYLEGRFSELSERSLTEIETLAQAKAHDGIYEGEATTAFLSFLKFASLKYRDVEPATRELHFFRALALFRLGNYTEALKSLAVCKGKSAPAHWRTAQLLFEIKDYGQAIYHIRTAIDLDKDSPNYQFLYASILKESGYVENSERQRNEALKMFNNWPYRDLNSSWETIEAKAVSDQAWGETAEALTGYYTVIRINPKSGFAYRQIAEILHMTGDKAGAREAILQATSLMPMDPKAKWLAEQIGANVTALRKPDELLLAVNRTAQPITKKSIFGLKVSDQ